MRLVPPLVVALAVVLALCGCAGVSKLGADGTAPLADRAIDIRVKVDEALEAGRYADAWNLEAQAGTDRARLEAIALAALAADSGPYDDMLAALFARFGGLSETGRARVDAVAATQEVAGDFDDAAATQLLAADDAPAYEKAWDVYRRAPVDDALAILRAIEEARGRARDASPSSSATETPK